MAHLIQILLPLYDNTGRPFPQEYYSRVRSELTERFGGLTAYSRAPAEGLWDKGSDVKREDIVVLEVMSDAVDRVWWGEYRVTLERLFRQDQVVVRAQRYEAL